eukprot:jgi/Ulvmu1/11149/UM071_0033.1
MLAGSGLGTSAFAGNWVTGPAKPADDVWASSVFQHLVSWEPAARQCTGPRAQRIEKHTSALQELFLRMQFCAVEDRPALACSLRSQFLSTFNALCTAEAPEAVRDCTFLSDPTLMSELADRSTLTSLGESLPMEAAVHGECSDIGPEDPALDHIVRPQTEFPTDASYINSKVKHLFFEMEGEAKRKVIEFMEESDTFLPPVVRFKGVETVASINRLAAFTGVRFFRSCAIQCLAVTRDGSRSHSTPSTVRSVDIDPFSPESISLLIQIIEGHAPRRITLQQALDIFAVFEYCLADCLFALLPEYLEPMIERLNSHEVVLLLSSALRSCPTPDPPDDQDTADSARAVRPTAAAPTLSPAVSGGVPLTPRAAADAARPRDASPASPRAPRTAAVAAAQPTLAMRMIDAAMSNAAVRRRDRRPEDAVALAAHVFQSFVPLNQEYCEDLLQMCFWARAPGWLRAGCLAASCHCAPQAAPPGPSSPSSGPSSPPAMPASSPSAATVTAAASHVLNAWGSSPEQAAALQRFLATTAAAAPTAAAVQMWTAALWHFAAERRALAYARITHALTPVLPPIGPHEPGIAIPLPLSHPGRSLVIAKMPIARWNKIRWSTPCPAGFALAAQSPDDNKQTQFTSAPPIGAFIRNQGSSTQRLRFALGIMPEPAHVGGGAAVAAAAAERVVGMVATVQRAFAAPGSLRDAVEGLWAGVLPVYFKARSSKFPPGKPLGFGRFPGHAQVHEMWNRFADGGPTGRWVGHPVYVFFVFEQYEQPADASEDAAAPEP